MERRLVTEGRQTEEGGKASHDQVGDMKQKGSSYVQHQASMLNDKDDQEL